MADSIMSSHPSYGMSFQTNSGSARSLYLSSLAAYGARPSDNTTASLLPTLNVEESSLGSDKGVAELAIRRLTKEIETAKEELKELEDTLTPELQAPPTKAWLMPLMVVGLMISLYGSMTASNTAELGATGLVLLWSLSAFWFIYTHDMRLERAKDAHKAEVEIWTSRINELQRSLEQHQRVLNQTAD